MLVRIGQRCDDLLVDLIANIGLALQSNHIRKTCAFRHSDWRVGDTCVLVTDIFDEEERQHVILLLARIHAATEFVAAGPKRAVEFGFFQGHRQPLLAMLRT